MKINNSLIILTQAKSYKYVHIFENLSYIIPFKKISVKPHFVLKLECFIIYIENPNWYCSNMNL